MNWSANTTIQNAAKMMKLLCILLLGRFRGNGQLFHNFSKGKRNCPFPLNLSEKNCYFPWNFRARTIGKIWCFSQCLFWIMLIVWNSQSCLKGKIFLEFCYPRYLKNDIPWPNQILTSKKKHIWQSTVDFAVWCKNTQPWKDLCLLIHKPFARSAMSGKTIDP